MAQQVRPLRAVQYGPIAAGSGGSEALFIVFETQQGEMLHDLPRTVQFFDGSIKPMLRRLYLVLTRC
jgi:hypothetical protein